MWKEFKEFVARGNVLDLAVAVILGGAFGKIVSSMVDDVLMPGLGVLLGKVHFTNLFVSLNGETYPTLAAAKAASAPILAYGSFFNNIINFLILAFVIFLMVRFANRFRKPAPAAAPTTRDCPQCLMPVPLKAVRCGHCTSAIAA